MSFMEMWLRRAEMLRDWQAWAERICQAVERLLPGAEVYLIGSVARGDHIAASDVDLLVVSPSLPDSPAARSRLKAAIEEEAGLPHYHPFEIHMATPQEAEAFLRRGPHRRLRPAAQRL